MTPTNFSIQAGEPFPTQGEFQRIRVTLPVDRDYWLEVDDFEVLMQIRCGQSEDTALVADLADYLTVSMDDLDILIDWSMTGSDTRTLEGGFYDLLISDPDTIDAHALIVLSGRIRVRPIITAAVEEGSS